MAAGWIAPNVTAGMTTATADVATGMTAAASADMTSLMSANVTTLVTAVAGEGNCRKRDEHERQEDRHESHVHLSRRLSIPGESEFDGAVIALR